MCNESFEEYCARMTKDREWADHVLVVAMARTLQRDIMVVTSSPSSGSDDIIAWVVGQDNFQGDPILLGHIWEHHYESLEPTDSSDLKVKGRRQDEEKIEFDENDTKNQMSMFGGYRGDIVMPVFSDNNNSGQRNPFQYNSQDPMNQMGMFDNYGGNNAMPVGSGDDILDVRNPFLYDSQVQMNQMALHGNYGDYTVMPSVPVDYRPSLINPIQDNAQAQMNQTSTFGNYGGHFVVPSFPGDNISSLGNPVQYSAEYSHEAEDSLDEDDDSLGADEDFLDAEDSLDSEDSSIDSLDSFYSDNRRIRYHRKHGKKFLRKIRSYLSDKPAIVHLVDKDFAIDNSVVDSRLEKLKMKIIDVASHQPYWGEQIPTRWFLLEQQLMRLRDAGKKVISRSSIEELNMKATVQIKESEELDLFLKYLHETGTIIYFSIEVLRDHIVLDPKWLIDALKLLINAHPNLQNSQADIGAQSNSSIDSSITQKWSDFKDKGILSPEIVDALWTKDKHPELHAHRNHILLIMEQFNIIAKPRSFSEIGEKVENYFLAPCMLRQESPREVISLEQDPHMVSTPVLCCVFRGKYLPPPIFHRLIAACITRWPVAKKKETSENLIFCGCCVFDIDLFHRLTLHCRSHIVYARITRMVIDEVRTLDAKLCARVRKFITLNLSKITSYLGQNLQYELRIQSPLSQCVSEDGKSYLSPAFEMWLADEGHDPETPITPEHMNHARLCVALVTVCGNAMRDIILTYFPVPYNDIYQAILANRANLTRRQGRPLLNPDQIQLVFPDPQGQTTGTVDQFDLSLLYTLIRNVSTVSAPPVTGWGKDPVDQPRDRTLGASVERIRSYRNHISGHSPHGKVSHQDLQDYWNKFEAVIQDIEAVIGGHVYSQELEKQRNQVISIYEAC